MIAETCDRSDRPTRVLSPAAWVACFVAASTYLALATYVSFLFPKSSDQVAYFTAGVAVAHGHLRLGGWLLTPPNFWTSDIALSALLSLVWRALGHPEASPLLLMVQPAVTWTAIVVSGLAIGWVRGMAWPGVLVIATLLAVPLMAMRTGYFVTLSAVHLGSVLYALWALHFAARVLERPGQQLGPALLTFLLLLLGEIGDPIDVLTGTLPILILCVLRAGPGKPRLILGSAAVMAAIASRAILVINTATGGFSTDALPLRFAPFDALGQNATVTVQAVWTVFGADPTGLLVHQALPELARFALMLVCLAAGWQGLRGMAPFPGILGWAALLDLMSLLFSDRISLEGVSIAAARYLFPLWIDLTILGALLAGRHRGIGAWAAGALALSVVSNVQTLPARSSGILSAGDNNLIAFLKAHDLHHGIGSWWASLGFGLASFDAVTVVPAITGGACGITPFVHIAPRFDFQEITRQRFFILVPSPDETYTKAAALGCFPNPTEVLHSGRYEILVYTR